MGASAVYAVDIQPNKLVMAERFGAVPVNAAQTDPVQAIRQHTGGAGVNVALELIGLPATTKQAVQSLGVFGRAALVGISDRHVDLHPYSELLGKEAEVVGVMDHLASEIPDLIEYARTGQLSLSEGITGTVPLEAEKINRTLDDLDRFSQKVRTVITL
jgi:threonine dehydrogenase-like Zn-dependent dehydrogenase